MRRARRRRSRARRTDRVQEVELAREENPAAVHTAKTRGASSRTSPPTPKATVTGMNTYWLGPGLPARASGSGRRGSEPTPAATVNVPGSW